MAPYRFYFINPTPKHIRDIVEFDAESDAAAMRQVSRLADGRATELWQFDRVVDASEPSDQGWAAADKRRHSRSRLESR